MAAMVSSGSSSRPTLLGVHDRPPFEVRLNPELSPPISIRNDPRAGSLAMASMKPPPQMTDPSTVTAGFCRLAARAGGTVPTRETESTSAATAPGARAFDPRYRRPGISAEPYLRVCQHGEGEPARPRHRAAARAGRGQRLPARRRP